MNLEFRVKGSSDFPYLVAFSRMGDKLTARCSCFAGQSRMACKHVAEIVTGDAKRIVSDNKDDVAKVVAWFAGSTAEAALAALKQAESEHDAAKTKLAEAKQAFSHALLSDRKRP